MENLIAQIEALGTALKGKNQTKIQTAKLKEANGRSWEWSTFHATTFTDYEVGDVIEIVPDLKWKEGQQYPYRNVKSVVGKRELSELTTLDVLAQQPGKQAESSGSSNGTLDQGKAIERRSIERQTSLKLVVELFKAGCGIDDLDAVVTAVIKAAVPLEEHLARQGALAVIPGPSSDVTNGAASSKGKPSLDSYKMETIGDLFTAALKRFKKSKADVLDFLSFNTQEELLEAMTLEVAWDALLSGWEGPSAESN